VTGKTTTTKFCVGNSGPDTTNPHDPNRTPGGSSCGSAAAVADFHVPIALGAQTGGSIIRPASYTEVFALKPTYNTVLPEGTKVFSSTFDTVGFLTRTIADLQLLADVFALEDAEPVQDILLNKAMVAMVKTPYWQSAEPGTIIAMKKAEEMLRKNDVEVHDVSLPSPLDERDNLKRLCKVIVCVEARTSFLQDYRNNKQKLSRSIARRERRKLHDSGPYKGARFSGKYASNHRQMGWRILRDHYAKCCRRSPYWPRRYGQPGFQHFLDRKCA
jgi:Asp-tRNA(Asn)/Glu-tRNA(Gln) amidotransferase A subunit family amidase